MSYRIKQDTKFNLLLGATSTTYADSGSRPTDGTGGSPTISNLTVQSNLEFNRNFLDFSLVHPSSNVQGQGWAFDFNVPVENRAKVLQIEFDYSTTDMPTPGTPTVDSDIIIYMYDVTNSLLIEPSNIKLLAKSTLYDRYSASFQSSSSMAIGRLIFHCATTTTTSFTVTLKNLSILPSNYVYGSPVTDWISYTPTFTGLGTVSSVSFYYRRNGDSIEIYGNFDSGTNTAVPARFSLPAGLSINTSKIGLNTIIGKLSTNNTPFSGGICAFPSTSASELFFTKDTASYPFGANGNSWANNTSFGLFSVSVPILGWSSSVQMSNDADARVIAAQVYRSTNQTINTSATDVVFDIAIRDETASFNTSTGVYVIPIPGWYEFTTNIRLDTGGSAPTQFVFEYVINGSGNVVGAPTDLVASRSYYFNPTYQSYFNSGTTVKLRITSATNSSTLIAGQNAIYIKRLSGPSQIAANEVIACEYNTSAGGSIANATDSIFIDFGTKETDSHGSVLGAGSGNNATATSTWRFVAPISGRFHVEAVVSLLLPASTVCDTLIGIWKNGASKQRGTRIASTTSVSGENRYLIVSGVISLVVGDYISIGVYQSTGGSRSQEASAPANRVSIYRIGN